MNQRRDDCPEKYQDTADARNSPEDRMDDRRHNIEKKPCAAKDD